MKRIESLLRSLNEAEVRYLIIGATAFAAHGWVRATADVDLFIEATPGNVDRLRRVLTEFGYDISEATPEDFLKYKILLRQYDLPLDLHPFVKGGLVFDKAWSRRLIASIGDTEAPFAALEDLIAMKKAAGRPKDAEDLRQLERLKTRATDGDSG